MNKFRIKLKEDLVGMILADKNSEAPIFSNIFNQMPLTNLFCFLPA